MTFDRSQTQSIRASDSPKLSSRCGQCKQTREVLKCERCVEIACAKCQKMDTAHLLILKQYDVSWFCNKCKPKALNAIHTDKEIEDRCAEYMTQITKRITRVVKTPEEKATKADLENHNRIVWDPEPSIPHTYIYYYCIYTFLETLLYTIFITTLFNVNYNIYIFESKKVALLSLIALF